MQRNYPCYFYFVESLGAYAVSYPLAILVMLGVRGGSPRDYRFLLKLCAWTLVVIIGLSVPSGKKVRYVLAFAPALSLISAYLFEVVQANTYGVYLRRLVFPIFFVLPGLCLVVLSLLNARLSLVPHVTMIMFALSLLQGLNVYARKQSTVVMATAALTFMMLYAAIVEPINVGLNRTRDFVVSVEHTRLAQKADLVFYQENADALPIKYLVNMEQEQKPFFIQHEKEIMEFVGPAFFVTDADKFELILTSLGAKVRRIATGRIGREPVVVFVKVSP
jgi:hypothetical protein